VKEKGKRSFGERAGGFDKSAKRSFARVNVDR